MSKHASDTIPARQGPKRREDPRRLPWKAVGLGAAVVALLAASFVVPPLFEGSDEPRPGHVATASGDGPEVGAAVAFAEQDAVTGRAISSETIAGTRTLLLFSEGVMCQACLEQIRDLERVGAELERKGIELVSITPDSPEVLRQAIDQYGIRTPMIADDDRDMSAAFDTLGAGMHPDTPGHAFVLVGEDGRVVWQRDYWLDPYRTMYVDPGRLLQDIP
jgi:peroxiredoxin